MVDGNSEEAAFGGSGDSAETLDRICDDFEAAWKNGGIPRLEEYLDGVPDTFRQTLQAELLRVEHYWRCQRGENPRPEDYAERIPELTLLTEIFSSNMVEFAADWRRWGVIEGRYQLRRELGRGRFGVVFLALEFPLDRLVAIKFQLSGIGVKADECEQTIFSEARMAGQFAHPHVVQVYFSGNTSLPGLSRSVPYIVFQYVEGVSLRDLLRQHRPDVRKSVIIVAALAEALQAAHDRGIVHRDVKPANVMIERDSERPFLTDFGLSVRCDSPSQAGVIAGSPCYMSPEQAAGEGHRVNGASDQFSLGAVFYELLTGQRPFQRISEVLNASPVPLTDRNPVLPEALERICLRMLARERSQRFPSCGVVAASLRAWLQGGSSEVVGISENPHLGTSEQPVRPRGLGAFSEADADVYPGLLPGPVGLSGLPISLEFWKQFLESAPNEDAAVGLLYGPSGCGKSSFLRAGLIPRLSADLRVILVECTAKGTERAIVRQLLGRGATHSADLPDAAAAIASCSAGMGQKLVLILDQFEQWLHGNLPDSQATLIRGLRYCDGVRIQAVVVVREEFWVAASRFGAALDVQFHDGRNASMLDLLPLKHAQRVLEKFGRGLGRIHSPPSLEQQEFLLEAVDSMQQHGLVSPIQLSLLSDALIERPWTVQSLRAIGDAGGAGLQMLRENLSTQSRHPEQRYFSQAAQRVLAALLPAPGMQIRGGRRSYRELRAVSAIFEKSADFPRLLDLLVTRLRLVTPCAPDEDGAGTSSVDEDDRYFELTHDYVVPILREWMKETLLGTREGRARLLLEERTLQWQAAGRPDRLLPSLWEWLRIRRWVPARLQTDSQKIMLRRINRRLLSRGILMLGISTLVLLAGLQAERQIAGELRQRAAVGLISGTASSRLEDLGQWLDQLQRFEGDLSPLLKRALDNAAENSQQQLNLLLALHSPAFANPETGGALLQRLPGLTLEQLAAFDWQRLAWNKQLLTALRSLVANRNADPGQRLRAACLLAAERTGGQDLTPAWLTNELSRVLVLQLSSLPPGELVAARKLLGGIGQPLVSELLRAFESAAAEPLQAANLAELLAEFARNELPALGEALLVSNAAADSVLFPVFARFGDQAVKHIREVLREPWSGEGISQGIASDLPQFLLNRFAAAGGVAQAEFLFYPGLPLDELQGLCEELRPYSFRPQRIRAAGRSQHPLLNVVWIRDTGRWLLDTSCNFSSLATTDGHAIRDGLPLTELMLPDGGAVRDDGFVAVWSESGAGSGGCRCIAGVTREELMAALESVNQHAAWRTVTSLSVGVDDRGGARYSAILREHGPKSEWAIDWDGSERFDWPQMDVSGVVDGEGRLRRVALWLQDPISESLLVREISPVTIPEQLVGYIAKGWRIASSVAEAAVDGHESVITLLLLRPAIVESQRQWEGSRRAAAASILMRMNSPQDLLPLISTGIEPETEAALLAAIADFHVEANAIESLLQKKHLPTGSELTTNQLRFLILAVGEFDAARRASSVTDDCVRRLLRKYAEDPDPGIHAAAQWSLRQLGKSDELKAIHSALATGKPEAGRRWYLQPIPDPEMPPIPLVVLHGPHEFFMGSPLREWERTGGLDGSNELRHRRKIPRTFAIGMHEITVAQYRKFRSNYREELVIPDADDLPATLVTWYDAAAFCNWLSEQAGIPRDQWCYDPDSTPGDGMRLLPDALKRTGYRLPTDAEWEYACRAGTDTARYCGDGSAYLSRYCNFAESGVSGELIPVGSLRPNAFGLFDTLGNASEWCQESVYAVNQFSGVLTEPPQPEIVNNEEPWGRLIRGGSIYSTPPLIRAAERMASRPDTLLVSYGFRVARTLSSSE